jgi:GT2 family glycosyltransferase
MLQLPSREGRHFGGKVAAFNQGYARVKNLAYDVIGNLDGDVVLERDYFEFLIPKFGENPELGVAGTPFREGSFQYDFRFTSPEHVSGACQMFRRECFEEIGGYVPREIGGVDLVAVTTARMKGWQTRTFLEKPYIHQRPIGTATTSVWKTRLKYGVTDYVLGCHPLWECARCLYQMSRRPVVLGGASRFAGFIWAWLKGSQRQVPPDFIRFRQEEEIGRLLTLLRLR